MLYTVVLTHCVVEWDGNLSRVEDPDDPDVLARLVRQTVLSRLAEPKIGADALRPAALHRHLSLLTAFDARPVSYPSN